MGIDVTSPRGPGRQEPRRAGRARYPSNLKTIPEITADAPKPLEPESDRGCRPIELSTPPISARAPKPTPAVAEAPAPRCSPAKAPDGKTGPWRRHAANGFIVVSGD